MAIVWRLEHFTSYPKATSQDRTLSFLNEAWEYFFVENIVKKLVLYHKDTDI